MKSKQKRKRKKPEPIYRTKILLAETHLYNCVKDATEDQRLSVIKQFT